MTSRFAAQMALVLEVKLPRYSFFGLRKRHIITAGTHLDEVVGVVLFLRCKVIQVCRVLVLQRQREGRGGKALGSQVTHSASKSSATGVEFVRPYLNDLQPSPSFFYFLPEAVLLRLRTGAGLAPAYRRRSEKCAGFSDRGEIVWLHRTLGQT